jgi:hypothetical protein
VLNSIPLVMKRELITGLRDRLQDVSRALNSEAASAECVGAGGLPQPVTVDAWPVDPAECLRVLMVVLLPPLKRGKLDSRTSAEALRLLSCIVEAAHSDDLRFFDAFNNFWEHWPAAGDAGSRRQLAVIYAALISHHLKRLPA